MGDVFTYKLESNIAEQKGYGVGIYYYKKWMKEGGIQVTPFR